MTCVPLRDDMPTLGSATYVRSNVGPRLTGLAALTVNGASEALDYRSWTVPAAAEGIGALTDTLLGTATHFYIGAPEDPALTALAERGVSTAEVRRAAAGNNRSAQIRWLAGRPADDASARLLVNRLASRGLLDEPLERLRRIGATDPRKIDALDLAPPLDSYLRSNGPVDWPHPFLPYQIDGIRRLVERSQLLLADDMGLGKTVQAAAAIRILIRVGAIENALIVAPASIMGQWYRALKQWAPDLRISAVRGANRGWRWQVDAHVFLVSFETLRSDFSENPMSGPRRRNWGVVLLDEAQKIKNRDVDAARACKRLSRMRSWALTGTPLENRVDDLRSICEFLVTSEATARELADPARLRETHARLQLRRRKRDVLTELPEKTVIEVPIELGARQRASYEKAERDGVVWLRQLGRTITITHVLELITRLKQVCNFCPESGESAKFDDLEERLDVLVQEGNRALVFTQYTDEQFGAAALARRLEPFRPDVYTGALSADEKEAVLRQFRAAESPRPLILSLRAGAYGLNLQEASYVFHFDRWWNPAVEQQAEDRSHRMGQTQPVTVYAYICRNTIEERIQEILTAKGALFREWIDDDSSRTQAMLTEEEIFGLVGLDAPQRQPDVLSSAAETEH